MDKIVCDGQLHASIVVAGKHVVEVVEEEHVSYQLVGKKVDEGEQGAVAEYKMR